MRVVTVVTVLLVAATACGGDPGTEATPPPESDLHGAWAGPVVVGEAVDHEDPLVAVAMGSDDRPLVSFVNTGAGTLEYRRCVDPACSDVVAAAIDMPDDRWVWSLSMAADPAGLPVMAVTAPIPGVEGPQDSLLVACPDADCSEWELRILEGERQPRVVVAPDGRLVLATVRPEQGFNTLLIRTCGDLACQNVSSLAEVPVRLAHTDPRLMVDASGAPVVLLGAGAGEVADGLGVLAEIRCGDSTCASYEVFEVETPDQFYELRAAWSEEPVVVYWAGEVGVKATVWSAGHEEPTTQVLVDPANADEFLFGEIAAEPGGNPVSVYVRKFDIETPDEFRDIVVAECLEADCSTGTLCAVAVSGDPTLGFETSPSMAIDRNGWPVVVFHGCDAGCQPNRVYLVRCREGCATAFPDAVVGSWGADAG